MTDLDRVIDTDIDAAKEKKREDEQEAYCSCEECRYWDELNNDYKEAVSCQSLTK